MHLNLQFPTNIKLPLSRNVSWAGGLDVVSTDGGNEVRNQRWSRPLRSYDVSIADRALTHPDLKKVLELWEVSEGGLHTFELFDWIDEEWVNVRFDSDLNHTSEVPWLHKTDTFTLREVR